MKNVMVDLETYGNTPGSMILSIGAVKFDPETGKMDDGLYVVIAGGGKDFGLHRDQSTVDWWAKQGHDARRVIAQCRLPSATPLPEALDQLDAYVGTEGVVWGNGADFDNAFLRAAYRAVSPTREPRWQFWNNRCYRTLKSLFPDIRMARSGVHHNALDDAKSQAGHAILLLRRLSGETALDFALLRAIAARR